MQTEETTPTPPPPTPTKLRSLEEIADFVKKTEDFFGVTAGDLAPYLPFRLWERAGITAKEGVTAEQIDAKVIPLTEDGLRKEIVGYLSFAWDKCNNQRGLSASRSISHFRAWCFALGDEEALAFIDNDDNYAPYGRPILEFLSDRFGYTGTRAE